MSGSRSAAAAGNTCVDKFEMQLHGFARDALEQESERLGISRQELMRRALLYYLADLDSGRIARRRSTPPPIPQ